MTEEEKNEKPDKEKLVLLVGKKKEMIQDAVKDIYRTQTGSFITFFPCPFGSSGNLIKYFDSNLWEYTCIGKTETEIEHDLFSTKTHGISHYKNGEMLFVRGLNSKRILERLADSVEEYCNGVLIINVPSMNIVPAEFKDQIIKIEPEKTPQAKLPRGRKQPYADQNEFNDFMKKIIEENPESSYLQIARKAISMMKKEKRFLDGNGNPLYKEATLKNRILKLKKALKHKKPSFSQMKNDEKKTVKKRHLKSDVKT